MTPKKQLENWNLYLKLINEYIKSDRITQINLMIDAIGERLIMAPASTKYHGAYPGGLVEHLIDTIYASLYIYQYYEKMGTEKNNLPSLESVVLCTAFHDIGKMGTTKEDYYLPETSEWHRKTLNKKYKINKDIVNLHHSDMSVYLLQEYNIVVSPEEWQAIKTHDGPGYDGNRPLYSIDVDILSIITRLADMMSLFIHKENEHV